MIKNKYNKTSIQMDRENLYILDRVKTIPRQQKINRVIGMIDVLMHDHGPNCELDPIFKKIKDEYTQIIGIEL